MPIDRPTSAARAESLALELFIAGYEGAELPGSYCERLERGLAGVILFARNLREDPRGGLDIAHLVGQTAAIHGAFGRPGFCCVDQEGGPVARLREPFTHLPAMRILGDTGDPELARAAGRQTGRECLAAGFNVDFAPVLDIDTNPDNPIIGPRAFASTPEGVTTLAGAFLDGLSEVGVIGCGKHFPGHGDTDTDSHLALPVLPFDRARLERVELAPFAALASRLPMVMTAHILFPELDAERPATLSPGILDELLRGHCRYCGLIVSDDLEMKGVSEAFSYGESVALGLAAGVELFLVCRREDALDEAVTAAAEVLMGSSAVAERALVAVERVRDVRARLPAKTPSEAAVRASIDHFEGRTLRKRFGLGTVRSRPPGLR